ncbi:ATP-binding protein [Mycobacterium sp.]|uniref:ATP-binding protein n=1 Tax=Mycobacterium sp. TaxID=1785 RepID=UPI001270FF03|nr:ATP-binding protein [Mycobacterium sp.]KAA8967370.1 MAG: HAMP domain-containing protein [Mycobacterium sp.]
MTTRAHPTRADRPAPATGRIGRPSAWSLGNWPVRWKVVAMVAVPLALSMVFGGFRIYGALTDASDLRLAADRATMIPAVTQYMSALDAALLAASQRGDVEAAKTNYQARRDELQARLSHTNVASDVRAGVETLLRDGQNLLGEVVSNSLGLREEVTTYAPILLTAENVVDASVRVDNAKIRAAAQGLSRALGARGQMVMQRLLITGGAALPDPELRSAMMALAGTEPSTLVGMTEVLGVGSPEAKQLQQQMVKRLAIMSNPSSLLVDNPELLQSTQITDAIAAQVINDTTATVTKSVQEQANHRRAAAIRDVVLVPAAILAALVIVLLVARSLIRPLRVLRDGALKVAHEDLEQEIARVRAGDDRPPEPLPVQTTEEIGQVAHAVDELHTQALLLAGDEARLRLLVNEMFETMSRRYRSLVDQQLQLIDRLERDEQDPERLDNLFRLDHLAARMRRNAANLLVLAGAPIPRGEQGRPVPLSTVVAAATSEVEDYRRVEISALADCTITAAAASDVVHLLAELIDNALRYSPPTAPVHVSAVRRGDAGVCVEIVDSGLGMTESDRRIANMRLSAGSEVTPDVSADTARRMGLFVVARLAGRHGIGVRLRGSSNERRLSGTTAEVSLPAAILTGVEEPTVSLAPAAPPRTASTGEAADAADDREAAEFRTAGRNGLPAPQSPVTALPRRTPGSSGISGAPGRPGSAGPGGHQQPVTVPQPVSGPASPVAETPGGAPQGDLIYQRMLSEWLVDPHDLARSPDLDWKSVWDHGWSAAAEAENVPVQTYTAHGLPVREPGARLVPGAAAPDTRAATENAQHRASPDREVAWDRGFAPDRAPAHAAPARDPEAIRASISSHFGGARAGRSHARDTQQGSDDE